MAVVFGGVYYQTTEEILIAYFNGKLDREEATDLFTRLYVFEGKNQNNAEAQAINVVSLADKGTFDDSFGVQRDAFGNVVSVGEIGLPVGGPVGGPVPGAQPGRPPSGEFSGGSLFGQGDQELFAGGQVGTVQGGNFAETPASTIFQSYLNQLGGLGQFRASRQRLEPQLRAQFLLQDAPQLEGVGEDIRGGSQRYGQFLRGQLPFGRLTGDALIDRLQQLRDAIAAVGLPGGGTEQQKLDVVPFTSDTGAQQLNTIAAGLPLLQRAGSGRAQRLFGQYLQRLSDDYYTNNPGGSFLNYVQGQQLAPFGFGT
jgi:hypothetical protein